MSQLRLIGLVLLITAILLALAAASTRTSHIQITDPKASSTSSADDPTKDGVQFTSIPVAWPLMMVAGLGLLLWFVNPSNTSLATSRRRKRNRRISKRGSA